MNRTKWKGGAWLDDGVPYEVSDSAGQSDARDGRPRTGQATGAFASWPPCNHTRRPSVEPLSRRDGPRRLLRRQRAVVVDQAAVGRGLLARIDLRDDPLAGPNGDTGDPNQRPGIEMQVNDRDGLQLRVAAEVLGVLEQPDRGVKTARRCGFDVARSRVRAAGDRVADHGVLRQTDEVGRSSGC